MKKGKEKDKKKVEKVDENDCFGHIDPGDSECLKCKSRSACAGESGVNLTKWEMKQKKGKKGKK